MLEDIYDSKEWLERLTELEQKLDSEACDQVDAIMQGDYE